LCVMPDVGMQSRIWSIKQMGRGVGEGSLRVLHFTSDHEVERTPPFDINEIALHKL